MTIVKPKKLLFLGDSFTVGTGLGAGCEQEAFPYQLIAKLKAQGIAVTEPKLYAVDGDTTKHLLGALNAVEPLSNPDHPKNKTTAGDYDLVVLSIGINDFFRGHSLADYKHHFEELLQRAIRFAGNDPSKVMVLSIPAWDAAPSVYDKTGTDFRATKYEQVRSNIAADPAYNTREGIAAEIDMFNAAAREVVEAANRGSYRKVGFVDITHATRQNATMGEGADARPDKTLFAGDGIHYSGKMYSQWVEQILPSVQKALGIRIPDRGDNTVAIGA